MCIRDSLRLPLRVVRVVRIGFFGCVLGCQSSPARLDERPSGSLEDEWLRSILGGECKGVHAVFGIRKLRSYSTGPDEVVEALLVVVCAGMTLVQMGGSDCLVGLLGALFGLSLIHI